MRSQKLEWEFHAKTNDGVFVGLVAEVVSAVSEEAQVAARDAEVKTTTNKEVAGVFAVGAEATADKCVRSNADAGDGVAEDESSVEVVVLFFRGVEAVGTLDSDVLAECIFGEQTTTEGVVYIVENSTTEHAKGKARCEGFTARRSWRRHHWSLWVFVGDGAGDNGTADGDSCEEGHD